MGGSRANGVGEEAAPRGAEIDEIAVVVPPHRAGVERPDRGRLAQAAAARPVAAAGQDDPIESRPEKPPPGDIAEPLVAEGRSPDGNQPAPHFEFDRAKMATGESRWRLIPIFFPHDPNPPFRAMDKPKTISILRVNQIDGSKAVFGTAAYHQWEGDHEGSQPDSAIRRRNDRDARIRCARDGAGRRRSRTGRRSDRDRKSTRLNSSH